MTSSSKHRIEKNTENTKDEKMVFQKNGYKIHAYVNLFE